MFQLQCTRFSVAALLGAAGTAGAAKAAEKAGAARAAAKPNFPAASLPALQQAAVHQVAEVQKPLRQPLTEFILADR